MTDLDGDGDTDILARDSWGYYEWQENLNRGRFANAVVSLYRGNPLFDRANSIFRVDEIDTLIQELPENWRSAKEVDFQDIDNDGDLDAMARQSDTFLENISGGAAPWVYAFTAAGAFEAIAAPGETVTLNWLVQSGSVEVRPSVGAVEKAGSTDISVNEDTTYTLTAANAHGAITRTVSVLIDSDGDGMADTRERAAFGTLEHTAAGDLDRDGVSNAAELRARTDPADASSKLVMLETKLRSGWFSYLSVKWLSAPGVPYALVYKESLKDRAWRQVKTFYGAPGAAEMEHTFPLPRRTDEGYVRIEVLK